MGIEYTKLPGRRVFVHKILDQIVIAHSQFSILIIVVMWYLLFGDVLVFLILTRGIHH